MLHLPLLPLRRFLTCSRDRCFPEIDLVAVRLLMFGGLITIEPADGTGFRPPYADIISVERLQKLNCFQYKRIELMLGFTGDNPIVLVRLTRQCTAIHLRQKVVLELHQSVLVEPGLHW